MPVETINPNGIFKPDTYSQMAIAQGARTIYMSGQVAMDAQGAIVGKGDLAAQVEQAYLNVAAALAAVGATFQDIAKLTVYVVDWTPDKMEQLIGGALRTAERIGFDAKRAITLIGVAALASPDFLVEVEAIAVLD
jgi:enamine deaminase RidA (YjgF/YER057c/UK114 family)